MARTPIPKNPDRATTIFRGKEVQIFDDVYADADANAPFGYKKDNTPYTKHHNNPDERILVSTWKMTEQGNTHPVLQGAQSQYSQEFKDEVKAEYETSDLTLTLLSDKFDIPSDTIRTWANKEGWERHPGYSPCRGWWTKETNKVRIETLRREQQEAISKFLDAISRGVPLTRAIKEANRTMSSFRNWKQTIDGFETAYNNALEYAADSLFSEGLDIMDESLTDEARCNVKDAKLISDHKMKAAAILSPRQYSEKSRLDISSEDGSMTPISPVFNVIGVDESNIDEE